MQMEGAAVLFYTVLKNIEWDKGVRIGLAKGDRDAFCFLPDGFPFAARKGTIP